MLRDVALLAEVLEVLPDVLKDKVHPLGLEVNWQICKSANYGSD